MVCLTRLFLSFITLLGFYSTVHSQLDEIEFISDAQCFGVGLFVNATCPNSTVRALNTIQVGTRPTDHGCHGNETAGDGTGCCQSASDAGESNACEFDFPISDNTLYHDQCNGVLLCRPGVQRINVIHGSCNTSVYPGFTQYMYFNYFCVSDQRISHMDLGHFTVEDAAVYIQSPKYPTLNISSSVSALSCSVETDNCNAIILIYVIERNLADVTNSTQCDQTQSLSIIEEDGSILVNWTCNDNTYTISQPLQTAGSYILVNLTNTMTTDGGKFWIGFKASLPANLTLQCPAVEKQDCFPTTSSTTTSTITTSTTASTTTFTTSDPTTTTTTTTGSTTSSVTTTSTSTATTTSSATSTTSTTSTTTTTSLNATTTSTTPDTTTFSATSTTSTTSTDTTSTSLAVTDFSTTSTTIVNSTATTTLSNATTTSTSQATTTSGSASTLSTHSAVNTTTHTTEINTTATNNETVVNPVPPEESLNTTLVIVIVCCIGAALIVAVIIGFIKRRDCKKEKNTEPEEPASKKGDPNESLKMVANEAEVSESKNSERKASVYVENEERNGSSDNNHGSHNDRNLVSSNESVEENGSGDSRHSLDMTSTHLNKDATDVSLNDESINSETPEVENLPTSNDDDRIDTEHTQNIENGQSSDNNKEEKVVEEHSTGESNISESPSPPRPAWREEEVTGTEKGDFKENTTRQLINGHEQIRTNVEPVTVVPIRRERRRDDSAYVRNYKHITASFFSDVTLAVRMQRLQRSFLKRKKKVNPKR